MSYEILQLVWATQRILTRYSSKEPEVEVLQDEGVLGIWLQLVDLLSEDVGPEAQADELYDIRLRLVDRWQVLRNIVDYPPAQYHTHILDLLVHLLLQRGFDSRRMRQALLLLRLLEQFIAVFLELLLLFLCQCLLLLLQFSGVCYFGLLGFRGVDLRSIDFLVLFLDQLALSLLGQVLLFL